MPCIGVELEIFYVNPAGSGYVLCCNIIVGADPCVRPAETLYVFHPFSANSKCLPWADTWVRPYGGKERCVEIV